MKPNKWNFVHRLLEETLKLPQELVRIGFKCLTPCRYGWVTGTEDAHEDVGGTNRFPTGFDRRLNTRLQHG